MDYYQTIQSNPDLQVMLAAIAAFQAIVLAVIGYWNTRENKRRDFVQEQRDTEQHEYWQRREEIETEERCKDDERSELRRRESMLSFQLSMASLRMGIAIAVAVESGKGNGAITLAVEEAKRAEEAYQDFLQFIAANALK